MSGNSKLQTSIKQVPSYFLSLNKLTVGTNSSIFYLVLFFVRILKET